MEYNNFSKSIGYRIILVIYILGLVIGLLFTTIIIYSHFDTNAKMEYIYMSNPAKIYDLNGARKAGYSDAEIADYLRQNNQEYIQSNYNQQEVKRSIWDIRYEAGSKLPNSVIDAQINKFERDGKIFNDVFDAAGFILYTVLSWILIYVIITIIKVTLVFIITGKIKT